MRLITKPVVLIAGILLAALLLAPTFSVFAQTPAERTYRYNENRTDAVATFRADRDVTWSLSGTDAGDFKISDRGVLTFAKAANYEKPADGADDANGDGEISPADEGVGNNVYEVTVEADGTPLVNATVKVIDVDDAGKVKLSHLQPAEGVEYTATATDEDDGYRDASNKLYVDFSANNDPVNTDEGTEAADRNTAELARWKWEKSQNGTSGWATISSRTGPTHTYTPATEDVGYYLRVTVTYSDRDLYDGNTEADADTDPVANAPIRTAVKVSEYPVMAEDNTNQAPVFADDETITTDVTDDTQQARDVDENDKNALVGAPVRARDSDVLYYSISNDVDDDNDDTTTDDMSSDFKINEGDGSNQREGLTRPRDGCYIQSLGYGYGPVRGR